MSLRKNPLICALRKALDHPESDEAVFGFEESVALAVREAHFQELNETLSFVRADLVAKQCLLTAHANAVGDKSGVWSLFFPVFVACAADTDYLEYTAADIVPLKSPLGAEFVRGSLGAGDPNASYCIPQFLISAQSLSGLSDAESATGLMETLAAHLEVLATGTDPVTAQARLLTGLERFVAHGGRGKMPPRLDGDTVVFQFLLPVIVAPSGDTSQSDLDLLISSMNFRGDDSHEERMRAAVTSLGTALQDALALNSKSRAIPYGAIRIWNAPEEIDSIREDIVTSASVVASKLSLLNGAPPSE